MKLSGLGAAGTILGILLGATVPKFWAVGNVSTPTEALVVKSESHEFAPLAVVQTVMPEAGAALRVAPECDREAIVTIRNQYYRVGMLHQRWRVVVSTREIWVAKKSYRLSAAFSPQKLILDVWSDPALIWPSELNEACRGLALDAYCPGVHPSGDPQTVLQEMTHTFREHLETGKFVQRVNHERMMDDTWAGAWP